jgi:cellulose synthase operon protein B
LRQHKGLAVGLLIRGLISLGVFLSYVPAACALAPEVIPFSALGHSRAIVLKGVNPEFNISVPAPAGGLDPENSVVRLHLEPSPLLNDDSSVRLVLHGEPIKVIPIKSLRVNPVVTIPIPDVPPGESFIHLSLQPDLYINHNYCQDLLSGNLFLIVGQDSFFQITPRFPDHSIMGFFRPFYRQVSLLVPAGLDQHQTEAALWLYSILAYQFRDRSTLILWQSDGNSAQKEAAQVVLHTEADGPDIERQGPHLRVRATSTAVQTLIAALDASSSGGYQPALVSRGLTVEAVNSLTPTPPGHIRLFRELGLHDQTLRGAGIHMFRLPFTLAQLGGRPKDLVLVLKAIFTPVNGRQGEQLSAQVYFNNTLVQTYNLTDTTQLQDTLFLPLTQLHRDNDLAIVFTYIPIAERCSSGPPPFTVQMHGDSYLTWNGHQGATEDFIDIPHIFLQPGQVIVETEHPALLAGIAYLLGMISHLGRQPVLPELLAADIIHDWSNLPKGRTNHPPAWRLMALSPDRAALPAPIHLNQDFEIYSPINQHRLLKARPSEPLGVLQYFAYQGIPTLWLSWWGANEQLAAQLAQALADPRTPLANQLAGNVVTATGPLIDHGVAFSTSKPGETQKVASVTSPLRVQTWDLTGFALQVAYPEEINWQILLRRYRSLVITLAVVLGGVMVWQLYRRLGRPPVVNPGAGRTPERGETP